MLRRDGERLWSWRDGEVERGVTLIVEAGTGRGIGTGGAWLGIDEATNRRSRDRAGCRWQHDDGTGDATKRVREEWGRERHVGIIVQGKVARRVSRLRQPPRTRGQPDAEPGAGSGESMNRRIDEGAPG
jgi:hypothetical protein